MTNQNTKTLSHYFIKGEISKRFYDTLAMLIGFVSSYFVISSLSVFHFGLYQLLLSFLSIMTSLSLGFIDGAVMVEMRLYLESKKINLAKRIFWENTTIKLIIAGILAAGVFFGSNIIAGHYGEDIGLFIKLISILIIIDAAQTSEKIFFKSIVSFIHWSFPAIKEVVKLCAILVFLFFGNLTILNVLIAHIIGEFASLFLVTIFSFIKQYRKLFRDMKISNDFLILRLIKLYGLWGLLKYGASRISKNSMPWLIKFFINTEAVAFYSLAINLIAMIGNLMPSAGFGPVFLLNIGDKKKLGFVFKQSIKYIFWLGIIFMIFGFIFVPPIIGYIFPKYTQSFPIFNIMLLALPLYGVYDILKSVLSVLREYKILTMRIVNETLVVPLCSFLFLPIFGIIGSGMVYVSIYLERSIFFYSRLVKNNPEFKIKFIDVFKFNSEDKDFILKVINQFVLMSKSSLVSIKSFITRRQ